METLLIKNCIPRIGRLQRLPALNVKKLKVINCGITEVADDAFSNMEDLEELDLSRNLITKLPNIKYLLGRVTTLIIDHNKISDIPSDAFKLNENITCFRDCGSAVDIVTSFFPGALSPTAALFGGLSARSSVEKGGNVSNITYPCFETLSFQHNELTELTDSMFAGWNIHSLKLNYNRISYISPRAFSYFGVLSLHLGNNNITKLFPGTFDQSAAFRVLDLSHNHLTELDSHVFAPLKMVSNFDLSHNGINYLPSDFFHNKTVLELDLSYNNLTELSEDAFKDCNLLNLDLSHNQLRNLPSNLFNGTRYLFHLHLDNNRLTELPKNILSKVEILNIVDLRNNSLTTLPKESFGISRGAGTIISAIFHVPFDPAVYLNGNPLLCDDDFMWFIESVKAGYVKTSFDKQSISTCAAPSEYAGMDLKDVSIKEPIDKPLKNYLNKDMFEFNTDLVK